MYIGADLHRLEQHLDLLERELQVCRRLEQELQRSRELSPFPEDPRFWEERFRFLEDTHQRIRRRSQLLTQSLESLSHASRRLSRAADDSIQILGSIE